MQSISHWRSWAPSKKVIAEDSKNEPTKLTEPNFVSFVSSSSGNAPIISPASGGVPEQNHEAWAEDFNLWMLERCVSRERHEDWGAVGALHVDFAKWSLGRKEVPCTRRTFEALLRRADFWIADGLVRGLILKMDLLAILPE